MVLSFRALLVQKVQILTPSRNTTARARPRPPCRHRRNAGLRVRRDVDLRVLWRPCRQVSRDLSRRCRYTQFTCFTGIKVQILTPAELRSQSSVARGPQLTCFTGIKVQILTPATSVLSRAWTSEPWSSEERPDALARFTNIYILIH